MDTSTHAVGAQNTHQHVARGGPPRKACECYHHYSVVDDTAPFVGFLTAAVFIIIFAALAAGLTLAISGLDVTRLHIMTTTGTEKRRFVFQGSDCLLC